MFSRARSLAISPRGFVFSSLSIAASHACSRDSSRHRTYIQVRWHPIRSSAHHKYIFHFLILNFRLLDGKGEHASLPLVPPLGDECKHASCVYPWALRLSPSGGEGLGTSRAYSEAQSIHILLIRAPALHVRRPRVRPLRVYAQVFPDIAFTAPTVTVTVFLDHSREQWLLI